MSLDLETLYGLLPAVYRTRDAAVGDTEDGPLKALLAIVAEQVAGLEENIEQLYDDQFIETCAPWAVPYIGDLVAHRPLEPQLQRRLGSARAEVANTIRFRRRKGTAAVLEELAAGLTGWEAAAVEYFLRLAATQYVNHVRPDHPGTVDLRDVDALQRLGTAFDRQSHTADVRRLDGAPRHNIATVGLFLWRQGSRRLTDAPAFRVDDRRRHFDALGAEVQLHHAAERPTDVTRLAQPLDVPLPITRRSLRSRLAQLYGPGNSFSISVGGTVLGLDEIEACDLSDDGAGGWIHQGQERVAVDPELGRISFPDPVTDDVRVTYHYASPADIGGGEYERRPEPDVPGAAEVHVPDPVASLADALEQLGGSGTAEIRDSAMYGAPAALTVAEDARLVVRAANGSRPLVVLPAGFEIVGGDSGEVTLDGLLLSGDVVVPEQDNRLQRLRLVHCTIVPGATLEVACPNVTVEIEHCIVGALRIAEESTAAISDSVVDGLDPAATAYEAPGGGPAGPLTLDAVTAIGKLHTAELTASDSILHAHLAEADPWPAPVIAEHGQAGYVRYSYAPLDAQLPPRFECRPREAAEVDRIVPRFTTLAYGRPGYCQLHDGCPRELRCGASDGGEMGAHHAVYAPQRVAAVRVRLDEYLRFGLEAGLIFAS